MLALPMDLFPTPQSALTWALSALEDAAQDPKDPWQQLAFSYSPLENNPVPTLKTVVLRGVDSVLGTFTFFTDTRSQKWSNLGSQPLFQALFYCPNRWVQLSIRGTVQLTSGGPDMERTFGALTTNQQQAYTSKLAPGAPLQQSQTPPLKADAPTLGATYFGKVECTIETLDFVLLHRKGHQRVSASRQGDQFNTYWLLP